MPVASAVSRCPRVASSAKSVRRCPSRIFSWWAWSAFHDWRAVSGSIVVIGSPFLSAHGGVAALVPQTDHRLGAIMLITQRTETGRAKHEVPARPRFEPKPARGEH